jgi:sugar O-acyltransferase (sialic acid O-acetyltransferase NeuD family)
MERRRGIWLDINGMATAMTSGLTPLVIIGAGGFGREVFGLVRDINAAAASFDFLGFLDDGEVDAHLLERLGASLLGPSSRLADLPASYVIGIGTPGPRRRIDAVARSWGRTAAILTHPSATIGNDVQIGDGAVIAAGARLTTHIGVGRHAHINLNCTIGHDAIVEDFATLYAGVHLGGGVVVEEGAALGTGCVILPNVRVGRGAVVGAGAVVVRDVAPDTTVVGTVARPTIRSRSAADEADAEMSATTTRQQMLRRLPVTAMVGDADFRVVGPGDAPALAELFSDIDETFFRPHPFTKKRARDIANHAGRDAYAILLDGQRPVAYGMLRGWEEGYETPSLGIAVRNDSQGRGLGRLMMAHLHAEAGRRGAKQVRLRVHRDNIRARRLYETLGYEYAGEDRGELVMVVALMAGADQVTGHE